MDNIVSVTTDNSDNIQDIRSSIAPPPMMKSVIGFGSCYIEHILAEIGHLVDGKHIWRATIPSLASSKLKLRSRFLPLKEASDFLTRETEKQITDLLRESDADAFLFDVAGDYLTAHIAVGDSIFPDFRTGVFAEKWPDLSLDDIPEMKGHKLIWADCEHYWNMWKYYFDKLYHDILQQKIYGGQKVIFLCHFLSELALVKGEPEPFKEFIHIRRRNARLADVYDFLSNYSGVRMIRISEEICFGSRFAPYGGPWEFHPDKEFYCIARRELLNELSPGSGLAERYLHEWLAANGRERTRAYSDREDAQQGLERVARDAEVLRGELAASHAALADRESRRAEAERIAENAKGDAESLRAELVAAHAALAERESRRAETERIAEEAKRDAEGLRAELAAAGVTLGELENQRARAERREEEAKRDAEALRDAAARRDEELTERNLALERETRRLRDELLRLTPVFDRSSGEAGNDFIKEAIRRVKAKWRLKREAARLRRAKFDEAAYLRLYPDVAQTNLGPTFHYAAHGREEGRIASFRD
ncbi:hypothetical protein [Methylosinus sporium]|uniref:Uncharacterized protein n=1 Tax=Methylosinus sporium TaxID=428 RepID=A0A2U1SV58_METSR|nr:hypothetical protein [Methylosinus sporium]PWB95505.1 hypothetical protein C5689_03040 [Methylosinus sporium]